MTRMEKSSDRNKKEPGEITSETDSNRLSREYINSLPIVKFPGQVTLVNLREKEEQVVRELRSERRIGFDTESRPSFWKGIAFPISLVQLATEENVYLIQIRATGFSDSLVDFFADRNIEKIGIGLSNDIEKLQNIRPFKAAGFKDMSKIAEEKGIIQTGIRGLTARYLGQRVTKGAQRTNWALSNLSKRQLIYAATDAWICLKIYPLIIADRNDYRGPDPENPGQQKHSDQDL